MEHIIKEYGAMIRGAVYKAAAGLPCPEDILSEVYFAVLLTVRKLGVGWTPPRSFIYTVIRNKVNDFLRQKYRDRDGLEELKKRQAEQTSHREETLASVHTLSHSEFKVFRLLGLGFTNQEIAESLHISPLTVRSHMKKVHAKCGIRERAKLALTAYQVCHQELASATAMYKGLPVHDPGEYMMSAAVASRPLTARPAGGGPVYVLPVGSNS